MDPMTADTSHWKRFKWDFTALFVGAHVAAIASIAYLDWGPLAVALLLHFVIFSFGISFGYHRLLTHRTLDAPKWLEYTLATIGALALQGPPAEFVGTHRYHHAHAETESDVHSPAHGFFWSYMGWLFTYDMRSYVRYAPESMQTDRWYGFLSRHLFLPQLPIALGLWWFGGTPYVMCGVFLRIVLVWHTSFLVNAVTHTIGSRPYPSRDSSTNNWLVALVSYGEGWHNNHHASPRSARLGHRWWELDVTWWFVCLCEALGLVHDVRRPEVTDARAPAAAATRP
jgi:stearoyl-CoA desaturase (delta-9 desaturase)